MHADHLVARSLLLCLALAATAAGAGCVTGEEQLPPIDPALEEEIQSRAQSYAEGGDAGDEVPYASCSTYGECAYCEERYWDRYWYCAVVCYSWYCYDGEDQGSECYWDCSYQA